MKSMREETTLTLCAGTYVDWTGREPLSVSTLDIIPICATRTGTLPSNPPSRIQTSIAIVVVRLPLMMIMVRIIVKTKMCNAWLGSDDRKLA